MTNSRLCFTLAIVGGGPNCLYIIERLYAHIKRSSPTIAKICVEAFDADGNFGSGCHYTSQPATNHLNRIADQISFGADETNLGAVKFLLDPSERWTLYTWCQNKYRTTGEERFNVGQHDWVERRLFGEVSEQVFSVYVEQLRRLGVEITLHLSTVEDIEENQDTRYTIYSRTNENRYTVEADFVVLCTGHGETLISEGTLESDLRNHARRHPGTGYIHQIYPMNSIGVSSIPPGCTVACRGMGLAAIDFILGVTEGRGGQFIPKRDEVDTLTYIPCGLEPAKIVPFSDSGVFLFTRAHNQKMNDSCLHHHGVCFTTQNIDRLRSTVGVARSIANVGTVYQLDFEAHVMPLIRLEMALLYYRTLFGPRFASTMIERSAPKISRFTGHKGPWHAAPEAGNEFLCEEVDTGARQIAEQVAAVLAGQWPGEQTEPNLCEAVAYFLWAVYGSDLQLTLDPSHSRSTFGRFVQHIAAGTPLPGQHRNPLEHLFDWDSIVDPLKGVAEHTFGEMHARVLSYLWTDIRKAQQGNRDNPLKTAIDGVWRDLRSSIRYVVEFGGLTAHSHAQFVSLYTRLTNRIAVGTSLQVMHKIFALAECGLLDLSVSRAPTVKPRSGGGYSIARDEKCEAGKIAEFFVDARVHKFQLSRMKNPLYANLCRRRLVREWINPGENSDFHTGGLDIQQRTNLVIKGDGIASSGMAALGPPTEGPLYFHLAAMRPFCDDPVIVDADRVVRCFWKKASHTCS